MSEQLTREQAIAFHESGAWRTMSVEQRTAFQMQQEYLCMPFDEFHMAVEKTLGRPVWTHEFSSSNAERMRAEIAGKVKAPTFAEIVALLPADKTVVVVAS